MAWEYHSRYATRQEALDTALAIKLDNPSYTARARYIAPTKSEPLGWIVEQMKIRAG